MITDAFDPCSAAIIDPPRRGDAPEVDACIATFSWKIEKYAHERYGGEKIGAMPSVTEDMPVWLIRHGGRSFAFFKTFIGGPACIGSVEESLELFSTKRFIVFGGAGCLDKDIARGKIMVPTEAYRDEGTSYHYARPADYIAVKNHGAVEAFMKRSGLPYVAGKTWTTDAFYRETVSAFRKRKADGCVSVEMECAALQAMCDFRGLELYMFFTGGDLLDAPEWDARNTPGDDRGTQNDTRHFDIALALAEYVSGK